MKTALEILSFLTVTTILIACKGKIAENKPYTKPPAVLENPIKKLLKPGKYYLTASYNPDLSVTERNILGKVFAHLETNPNKAKQLEKMISAPSSINPSIDFGLTKTEFTTLLAIFTNKKKITIRDSLRVFIDDDKIKFKGQGRLSRLDSLTFSPDSYTAKYVEEIFDFAHEEYLKQVPPDSVPTWPDLIPPVTKMEDVFVFKNSSEGLSGLLPIAGKKYLVVVSRLTESGSIYIYVEIKGFNLSFPAGETYSLILDR